MIPVLMRTLGSSFGRILARNLARGALQDALSAPPPIDIRFGIKVKGLKELSAFLDQFPMKLKTNVMRGALRAGMKPIRDEARRLVPVDSGELREGLKVSVRAKGNMVTASLKVKGPHRHLAYWYEFTGARAHRLPGPLVIDGHVVAGADHPGVKPHPFLRPALDGRAQDAIVAAAEYIKQRLATRHSFDTSDINIEVEK